VFNDLFILNCIFYDLTWENIVELDRPQMTVWHICITCWIPKATNTHSKYVILITFPLQQYLRESVSILR